MVSQSNPSGSAKQGQSGLFWLLLVVAGGAGFFLLPGTLENTDSACGAVEKRMTTLAAAGKGQDAERAGALFADLILQGFSNGHVAEEFVKQRYPAVPPGLSCPYLYWQTVLYPPVN